MGLLIGGGIFLLAYWCLGTFALLRRPGRPATARLVLALLAAAYTVGMFSLGR